MRVLVTGGAGFIGSHLVERLLARGERVSVIDDFNDYYDPAGKRSNLAAVRADPRLAVYEGDIRDQRLVAEIMMRERPEALVHLAARAGVRASIAQPELYLQVNVDGTHVLLQSALQTGVEHFVFGSSSSVYGADTPAPFREDAPADRPISPYGATKRMGEILAHTFHWLYGMPVTVLRLFTVYGPRCRPDLAVHSFSRRMLEGEPISVFGDGSAQRDFTYVEDIVAGFERAIDRPQGYRVFNLGGGRPITVLRLISLLEERLGVQAALEFGPPQQGDVEMTFAGIERAERLLAWRPEVAIEEGLDRWCRWYGSRTAGLRA